MKIKKSLLITAGAALLGAAGTVGGTMALFTSESSVDVTVKSANVRVSAEVKNLTLSSGKWDGTQYVDEDCTAAGKFTTGGTAKIKGSSVMLENVVPMDKVAFDIEVKNLSTVAIKARTIFRVLDDSGLAEALKITIDNEIYQGMTKVSEWEKLEVGEGNETIHVTIELPQEAGNQYQGKSFKLGFNVEAVQGNAATEEAVDADYLIYNANDLKIFSKIQRSNQASIAGKTVVLMDDIDLEGVDYVPINVTNVNYSFTFDGQDHTISNMKLVGEHDLGLFAHAGSSLIKNVKMDKANIKGIGRLGAVAGHALCGKIENCEVTNSTFVADPNILDAGGEYNGDKVGGVVGYLSGEPQASVKNCKAENISISGYRDLGGVVGIANETCTIDNVKAKNVVITCDKTNNYKNYDSHEKFDVHEVVGEKGANATVTNDTFENVTFKEIKPAELSGDIVQLTGDKFETGSVAALPSGTMKLSNISNNIDVKGTRDAEGNITTKLDATAGGNICSISNGATFEDVILENGQTNYHGFQHAGLLKFKDCEITGLLFSYGDMIFENCIFRQSKSEYNMWAYGQDVQYINCKFYSEGKFINVYNEGVGEYTVSFTGCEFINTGVAKKAAVNVKETSGSNLLGNRTIIKDCTTTGAFPEPSTSESLIVFNSLVQVDDRAAAHNGKVKVTYNDKVIYQNGKAI